MDSFFTEWLNKNSKKLSNKLNKHFPDLKPELFTTASLVLNACALLNLLTNNYVVFIFLFVTAYYSNYLSKIYGELFGLSTNLTIYYYNLATWVQIISFYSIFTKFYKYKISNNIIVLVAVILLLCNINFLINEKSEYLPFINKNIINTNKVNKLQQITKYFDESLSFVYILIITTYLYYKIDLLKLLKNINT